jgi:hypothetical protein
LWGIGLAVRGDRDDRLRQGRRFDARQELDPALLAASKLVTDLTEQCAVIGDLHHVAFFGGAITDLPELLEDEEL